MILVVDRNDSSWLTRRDDHQVSVVFYDVRDVAAAALLLGAKVRTEDASLQDVCRQMAVVLEGDPVPDYDQLGT